MAELGFLTIDVFADRAFQGAPIAVFPDAAAIPEHLLPAIAGELNLSETVFLYPGAAAADRCGARVFAPGGEVEVAGHPLLAAAHALLAVGKVGPLGERPLPLILTHAHGEIAVNLGPRRGAACFVQFSLRVNPVLDRYTPPAAELAALLSLAERDIDTRRFGVRLASTGKPYLVVPILDQAAVDRARFDYESWSRSSAPALAAQEILLFSHRTRHRDADFHGRLLGPEIGPQEDPPIGAVVPCFAGYLADHEAIREGTYTFAIDRGRQETRRSLLHVELDKRRDRPTQVRVGGDTVLVARGTLSLDA
ncbi:MAG: PhzF family phenazine biosynthesis protein [Pseudomonadales bacterium]|nr:PhzF family phenazine biosynthesis protein [Pseudomonadales bacterium]